MMAPIFSSFTRMVVAWARASSVPASIVRRVFKPQMLQDVVNPLAEGLLPVERQVLLRTPPGKLTRVDSSVPKNSFPIQPARVPN